MCADFKILEIKVPIIFSGTQGFPLHRDGRYQRKSSKTACVGYVLGMLSKLATPPQKGRYCFGFNILVAIAITLARYFVLSHFVEDEAAEIEVLESEEERLERSFVWAGRMMDSEEILLDKSTSSFYSLGK